MKKLCSLLFAATAILSFQLLAGTPPEEAARKTPDPLKPWVSWALWEEPTRDCPRPYMDGNTPLSVWDSRLALKVDKSGGHFTLGVRLFAESWVALPGDQEFWPVEVKAASGKESPVAFPVVNHQGRPSIRLTEGSWQVEGAFVWNEIPQRIAVVPETGLLSLAIEGKPVESPVWDSKGVLWLKRVSATSQTDKDFLSLKVYSLLEDGIPLWLQTQVELIVSGKSREEDLGRILPEGWKLSGVESPIPVAVDDDGRVKVQVRAGRWIIKTTAFRLDNPHSFRFPPNTKLAASEELVAFRSKPEFRMVDISGPVAIDASQTTFPKEWREYPVYHWDTSTEFAIQERMRGMGMEKPAGLKINREWWLDENGRGLTFRDQITGSMQRIWRLDIAQGQDLGSVQSDGQGQLITRNPANGASGVELRNRNLNLNATGRMTQFEKVSATGWRCDADNLSVTLNLPPGWRLFALFGADWVSGDWLTAWTLLDLFLLLVFTLAVGRLFGPIAGLIAFLAFGLSYQEPEAPVYAWLAVLAPVALLRFVPSGAKGLGRSLLVAIKWIAFAVLLLFLVPFLAAQVEKALYPQLERTQGIFSWAEGGASRRARFSADVSSTLEEAAGVTRSYGSRAPADSSLAQQQKSSNLLYDTNTKIQTGPAVPEWSWRTASFGWNGPVTASQEVHPVLISMGQERLLTVLRVALLILLVSILLGVRRLALPRAGTATKAALLIGGILAFFSCPASAQQFPDQQMLDTLKKRLTEISDAYPTAAEIPSVALKIDGKRLLIDAEIHAATRTAVPLPGKFPAWSPVTVQLDGVPEAALRRADGYLWIALERGVHQVHVEGLLGEATEWDWAFQLRPHRVQIDAPEWTFSGVRPDGAPEQQVFFSRKQKVTAIQTGYDRQDYQAVAHVERHIELGLVWQVHTTVTRLSSADGKALSLRIPLLPGENVVSANAILKDGFIEVRLPAHAQFSWESELQVVPELKLAAKPDSSWVESWFLVASPVWNLGFEGLSPIFERTTQDLTPIWHPWPGESVTWKISRPEAIPGATVTVGKVSHEETLGKRQRTSQLDFTARCSLAQDFLVELPQGADVTSLSLNSTSLPVRREGAKLVIPLRTGEQTVAIAWKSDLPLEFKAQTQAVRMPVESANISTTLNVPEDRWVLWAYGPQQGPAVRFWGILIVSLLAAWALGRLRFSPLGSLEWMLLAIGLTQAPLPGALVVIGWLFWLSWRGAPSYLELPRWRFNLFQIALVLLTPIVLGVLVFVAREGLLGDPDMFIRGQGSSEHRLHWYLARTGVDLPHPACYSVSIWWYRLLMLAWALWLAWALVRWLAWGWKQFSSGSLFLRKKPAATPPPIPKG